jgi:imidazolonepropionase
MMTLTGPFTQLLPLTDIPVRGKLVDEQLSIIPNAGILTDHGKILATGNFNDLREETSGKGVEIHEIVGDAICLPGFIDCHTHLLFAGSRAIDYAARNAGRTYQEIGAAGGGIKDTMGKTRAASTEELTQTLTDRLDLHLRSGITTVEVKSGYGLSVDQELRMLRIIKKTGDAHTADVVSTCLAAHVIPSEVGDEQEWLRTILKDIVPVVEAEQLASRFDIFVEGGAFTPEYSRTYLKQLKSQGFGITIHGDQFTVGGSQLAIDVGALSVDHLEVSGEKEIMALADSKVIPVALPGASIGLGCAFTPARKLLDAGASLAIASDWNPGSAPMGDLLTQAAILGTFEKLTTAEVLAGLTFRAAAALGLSDRGSLAVGQKADFITFHATDYREILYKQGQLKPNRVWKNGLPVT